MILIIDAYNMTKKFGIGEGERSLKRFIDLLAAYAHDKKHKVYLVFDGYRDDIAYLKTEVQMVFAGRYNKSADDEIVTLIESLQGKELCVVSDDRALSSAVRHSGELVIKNDIFWYALERWKQAKKTKKSVTVVQKGSTIQKSLWSDASSELDALMKQGSERMVVKDLLDEPKTSSHESLRNTFDYKKKHADEKILKKL